MGKPIIKILDSVHCKANKEARKLIIKSKCLQYKEVVWKRGPYGRRIPKEVKQNLITGRDGTAGTFLTGLLKRVKKNCKNIKITGRQQIEKIKPTHDPKLKGIEFRKDQIRALKTIKRKPNGIILFPTGSGKTILALATMAMFPKQKKLFLCHTIDLIEQTVSELKQFKFKNVFVMGDGQKINIKKIRNTEGAILVATIQSYSKLDIDYRIDTFDITIVDEVHHVNNKNSQYGNIIESSLSPRKYGFTATMPTKTREILTNEGYFGPVITEFTLQEGIESGILAIPKINLIPVAYNSKINLKADNNYSAYYNHGIIKNRFRNLLIINEANKELKNDNITLVVIDKTKHGEILQKMFQKKLGLQVPFVRGSTKKKERLQVKKNLQSGKIKIGICSKVWREGINIPSLNHIINACGMKEEKMMLQIIGRGLRTKEGKRELKFTDFLDPYKYLAEHTILRLQVYKKKGWI